MVLVYSFYDRLTDEIYVGITDDLDRRTEQHREGYSKYTKKFKNIELFHYEEFVNHAEARKREKYFKSGAGKEKLRKILKKKDN